MKNFSPAGDEVVSIKYLRQALNDLEDRHISSMMPRDILLDNLSRSCIQFLKSQGYAVRSKFSTSNVLTKNKELVTHFYNRLQYLFPDIIPANDEHKDATIAKSFVGNIMSTYDLDHKQALAMCSKLINILFFHIDEFNFSQPIYNSFSVFGQDNMKWVTEKAISILNSPKYIEERNVHIADSLAEEYLKSHEVVFGFQDLDELINRRNYGKEK